VNSPLKGCGEARRHENFFAKRRRVIKLFDSSAFVQNINNGLPQTALIQEGAEARKEERSEFQSRPLALAIPASGQPTAESILVCSILFRTQRVRFLSQDEWPLYQAAVI
jgi:hypothetical protein